LHHVVWEKLTDVSQVLAAIIIRAHPYMKVTVIWIVAPYNLVEVTALMMEAAGISETSANFYQTTQHNDQKKKEAVCTQRFVCTL
jgi:hypothetical protein